jgi:hypothetical protein
MGELRWVESTKGAVALDDRAFPVLFVTWAGWADDKTVRAFFTWNEAQLTRVVSERVAYAMINDAIDAERPDAPTRALLAELTTKLQKEHARSEPYNASSVLVIESPVVRGAITAIGWLMGGLDVECAPTCAVAIERTQERFRARAAPWPMGLTATGYRRAKRK